MRERKKRGKGVNVYKSAVGADREKDVKRMRKVGKGVSESLYDQSLSRGIIRAWKG